MTEAGKEGQPAGVQVEDDAEAGKDEVGNEVMERDATGRWSRWDVVLGRGAFKTVYKGFDEEEGIEVAWNRVRVSELVQSKEERDRLFAEIRVLKQLKHKNIMTFFDSWLDSKHGCVNFITELFTSGTLRQYRKRHKHIDPEVLKRWAWQILCGLVYLHGHTPPIIHRDLKCDNIFINGSEGVVKIGDLGLATMLRARTAPQSVLGTPEFMAPELYDEEYDDRVDVYSFGMCLLELATLEYPYSECRNAAQIYRKVSLGVRPAGLAKVPTQELAEFVTVCIAPREERPRARQLLKHPYFASVRSEKAAVKLSAEALLGAGASSVDLHLLLAECAGSTAGSAVSRTSSELATLEGDHSGHPVPHPDAAAGRYPSGGLALVESLAAGLVAESYGTAGEVALPGESAPGSHHQESSDGGCSFAAEEPVLTGDREFCVRGRLQGDEDKLNLRLRIGQPHGPCKTVEFDFDLGADTAMSVASEMVEDLSLSHEDAQMIARAIKNEIRALTGSEHERAEPRASDACAAALFSDEEELPQASSSPRPPRRATADSALPPRGNGLVNELSTPLPPPRAASLDEELRVASAPASKAGSLDGSPLRTELSALSGLASGLAAGSPGGLAGAGSRSESSLAVE
ncbi:hypothetical protein WJX81_007927 [Elliptochloris bilobata]|uniref:non-specific serine/threonine protein kinase n=1 Tax=Elliptochloris bilobata TaxID=381761 RepID=A0AAW1RKG1_9CHLO